MSLNPSLSPRSYSVQGNHVDLELDHTYLDSLCDDYQPDSPDEVDIFLSHLNNDELFGLQLRMTPIEFAINTIQSHSMDSADSVTGSEVTTPTSNCSTPTPNLQC